MYVMRDKSWKLEKNETFRLKKTQKLKQENNRMVVIEGLGRLSSAKVPMANRRVIQEHSKNMFKNIKFIFLEFI